MKRSTFALVAIALAACAGAAFAVTPDMVASAIAFVTDPHVAGFALAWGPLVRNLQAQHAKSVEDMGALINAAEQAGRDFTEAEQQQFEALKQQSASLKARVARAQEQELEAAGLDKGSAQAAAEQTSLPNDGRSVTIPASAVLQVEDNAQKDAKRGFAVFGEFARSVHGAWRVNRTGAGQMDKRLAPLMPAGWNAAAPTTFGNESVGADGGFLVPPAFAREVFQLSLAEDSLLPLTDNINVEGNGIQIPKDETTPWGSNGVRAYWQGEATAGTPTKPSLGLMDLRLKKLLALTPVTDELLADTSALTGYLPKKMGASIRWKTNEAILFGAGAGLPVGAFTGLPNSQGAFIVVAKESGQATLTLDPKNLAKMIARLPPGSYPNAVWIINNDVLPALFTLTLGNYPIYLPGGAQTVGGIQMNPYGMLLGRPVIVSQHAASFSSQGDILLADFGYYQSITKSEGVTMASSMHLYFDADAMAFRVTFRVDGQPKIVAPISPAKGSNTLSPFVTLQAR